MEALEVSKGNNVVFKSPRVRFKRNDMVHEFEEF